MYVPVPRNEFSSVIRKIRINVPLRLAVANNVPVRLRAIQAISDLCADTLVGEIETEAPDVTVFEINDGVDDDLLLMVGSTIDDTLPPPNVVAVVVDRSNNCTDPVRCPG
ncbi:hypothetical protein BLOT_013397 [Blomia tropicalis]|nr:hypothetical protein BLOT_013397 [Blomia tropicalis]